MLVLNGRHFLDTSRMEVIGMISWGLVNVTVSLYPSDVSWAGLTLAGLV